MKPARPQGVATSVAGFAAAFAVVSTGEAVTLRLEGRTALVSGAGRAGGIGFAVARALVAEGASVTITDLDDACVSEAAAQLGSGVRGIACDVRDAGAVARAYDIVRESDGRLDILVNNAGITQPARTVEIAAADWETMIDTNLRGTLLMSQAAIPLMRRGSAIVCIASVAAQRGGGLIGGPHYSASKAGVVGLMRAMARDLAPDGIRVNAINPGVIMSDMTRPLYDEATTARVLPLILLGRFGEPEDVARAALFLASDDSSYITGASIDVNGGMHFS